MSEDLERLVRTIETSVERRGFLGKLAAASLALVTALFGMVPRSEALVTACVCCLLCRSPSTSCSGCECIWTWRCCPPRLVVNQRVCGECYSPSGSCTGSCTGIRCSWCQPTSALC